MLVNGFMLVLFSMADAIVALTKQPAVGGVLWSYRGSPGHASNDSIAPRGIGSGNSLRHATYPKTSLAFR